MESRSKDIESKVDSILLKEKSKILNIIIDEKVELEVNNRVKILKSGLELEESIQKELSKILEIKPTTMYSADGVTKTSFYDESYIKKKDSLTANQTALSKALTLCIDSNTQESYKALAKLISQIKI